MRYDNSTIEKIKAFGALGTPIREMIFLIDPEDCDQFEKDILDPNSEIYKAYHKGTATGEYTMGKALFDAAKNNNSEANEKLNQRQKNKRIDATIHDKFNL